MDMVWALAGDDIVAGKGFERVRPEVRAPVEGLPSRQEHIAHLHGLPRA
jgi:hypothetical protein